MMWLFAICVVLAGFLSTVPNQTRADFGDCADPAYRATYGGGTLTNRMDVPGLAPMTTTYQRIAPHRLSLR